MIPNWTMRLDPDVEGDLPRSWSAEGQDDCRADDLILDESEGALARGAVAPRRAVPYLGPHHPIGHIGGDAGHSGSPGGAGFPFHIRITSEDSDDAESGEGRERWVVDMAHVAPGAAWVTEIRYTEVPDQLKALAHLLLAPTAEGKG